jgi:hypothetical protein
MNYQFVEQTLVVPSHILLTNKDGSVATIPADPANSDYQAYLATLASELSNPSTPKAGE